MHFILGDARVDVVADFDPFAIPAARIMPGRGLRELLPQRALLEPDHVDFARGEILLGMQVQTRSSDVSRDLGRALRWALDAEPGQVLSVPDTTSEPQPGERLQDLLDPDAELEVELHSDFGWWLQDDAQATGEVAMSLERANAAIMPTERVRQLVKIWIPLPLSHASLSFLAWGHSGALLSEQIGQSSRATAQTERALGDGS